MASTRPGRAQSDDGRRWRAQGRRMSAEKQRDARRAGRRWQQRAAQGQGGTPLLISTLYIYMTDGPM
jgi:hypothetical protein